MQPSPPPGAIIAGKYRVDRVLGRGGMGLVLAVWHVELEKRFAIKLLLPELAATGEIVARFLREARAASHLQNEHLAQVSDVGRDESGAPYMVMELLEGRDLADLLQQRGALDVSTAIELVLQACEGIAEAHAHGIIHRDLKPANLFLTSRRDGLPCVKVLDFGISKRADEGARVALTQTTSMLGSPLYMSPEQLRASRDVDLRADVWALGVTLFELLTRARPFEAEDLPSLTLQIVSDAPRSLRAIRPDVPKEIESIVLRCLEKDRALRWSDVGDLAVALGRFAPPSARGSVERILRTLRATSTHGLEPVVNSVAMASTVPTGDRPTSPVGMSTTAAISDDAPSARPPAERRSRLAIAIIAGAGCCLGAAAFFVWPHQANTASAPTFSSGGSTTTAATPAPVSSHEPMRSPSPIAASVTAMPPASSPPVVAVVAPKTPKLVTPPNASVKAPPPSQQPPAAPSSSAVTKNKTPSPYVPSTYDD